MERKRIVKSATAANTTERRLGEQKHWLSLLAFCAPTRTRKHTMDMS